MQLGRGGGAAVTQSVDKVDKRNATKSEEDSRSIARADKEDVADDDSAAARSDGGVSSRGSENDSLGAVAASSVQRELKSGERVLHLARQTSVYDLITITNNRLELNP